MLYTMMMIFGIVSCFRSIKKDASAHIVYVGYYNTKQMGAFLLCTHRTPTLLLLNLAKSITFRSGFGLFILFAWMLHHRGRLLKLRASLNASHVLA